MSPSPLLELENLRVSFPTPKGQVEVTFPQKGNKVVTAMQGDPIGKVCQKAGVRVKFDCKNGRCGTCEVSINGRSKAKVCQGAKVPSGGDSRHFEPHIRGLRANPSPPVHAQPPKGSRSS